MSQTHSGTCSHHDGVKCYVCPGVLCGGGLSAFASVVPWLQSVTMASYADIESSVAPLVGKVEVYKVHHHGSRYSSNAAWLATTTPKVGILSVGSSNTFGHPTLEALGRLHSAGVTSTGRHSGTVPPPSSAQMSWRATSKSSSRPGPQRLVSFITASRMTTRIGRCRMPPPSARSTHPYRARWSPERSALQGGRSMTRALRGWTCIVHRCPAKRQRRMAWC